MSESSRLIEALNGIALLGKTSARIYSAVQYADLLAAASSGSRVFHPYVNPNQIGYMVYDVAGEQLEARTTASRSSLTVVIRSSPSGKIEDLYATWNLASDVTLPLQSVLPLLNRRQRTSPIEIDPSPHYPLRNATHPLGLTNTVVECAKYNRNMRLSVQNRENGQSIPRGWRLMLGDYPKRCGGEAK